MRALRLTAPIVAGLAIQASAAAVDPAQEGRHAVGSTTLVLEDSARLRTLTTELWYPAETPGRDAPPRRERFRLVLLVHGHCGSRTNYEYLAESLASWGFVVAAPGLPGVQAAECDGSAAADPQEDVAFVLRTLRDRLGPAAVWAKRLRRGRIGLVAHSLGAWLGLEAARVDADVRVLVLLAPFLGNLHGGDLEGLRPRRPVLVMGGTADATIPFESSAHFFEDLPGPAVLVKLEGGTHSGFGDDALPGDPVGVGRQHELTRRYAIGFLRRHLARDRRFARFLRPQDAASQGSDVELEAHGRSPRSPGALVGEEDRALLDPDA
jgi:predicted dienelactone hydrolase